MKVVVVGTGGVGAAVAAVAHRRAFFERITFADLDPARPERLLASLGDERARMRALIAERQKQQAALEAKAKALRPFVERLVTYAKSNTLASRRLAKSTLGDDVAVKKLFEAIGPRYADRAGGYTRVVKRTSRGTNDGRKLAYIAFV